MSRDFIILMGPTFEETNHQPSHVILSDIKCRDIRFYDPTTKLVKRGTCKLCIKLDSDFRETNTHEKFADPSFAGPYHLKASKKTHSNSAIEVEVVSEPYYIIFFFYTLFLVACSSERNSYTAWKDKLQFV